MQNIFKGFKNFLIKSLGGSNDTSYSSLSGGGSDTPLARSLTPANLLNQNKNWVYACVNKIATAISGIELHLKKYNAKGDDVEVFDHAILKVLYKPNSLMTGRDFMYTIAGHLQLTGNAYILMNAPKNPTELFPLNPASIRANFNETRTAIISYTYTVGTKSFVYDPTLIVHLKKPNLKNPYFGAGVVEHIPEWIDIDSAALEFNRLFFKSGAAPSGILETDATDMKAMELAKAGFELKYAGAVNAHKTAVLGKGSKYTATSANPRDMEFSELDARFRDKILSAFGVPKSVLGIVDDVNRANAEASYYVFMMFTIDPEMKMLVAYINEWLLPVFTGTDSYYFDYDNIIPENDVLELQENQTSLGGQSWTTINEVRAKEGLPPIENGNFVYGGFATIPIGSPIAQGEKNADSTPVQKKKIFKSQRIEKSLKKDQTVDDIVAKIDLSKLAKSIRKESDEVLHKEFITRVSKFENGFVNAVKNFDKRLEQEVLASIEDGQKDYTAKDLFNVNQAQQLFVGFTSPILQELLKTEGQAQMDRLDTTAPFNPMNEELQKRVKKLLTFSAASYSDTTLKLLNAQLSEGVAAGESLPELTQRVSSVFGLTEQYRAERIARTTVFGTANAAARDAYKQSGVVKTVVWHTAEDELVCPECEPMDGKEIAVDATFMDGIEDPPLHPNCRCFTNAGEIEVSKAVEYNADTTEDAETKVYEELLEEVKAL